MKKLAKVLIFGLFARAMPLPMKVAEPVGCGLVVDKVDLEDLLNAIRAEREIRRKFHLRVALEKLILPTKSEILPGISLPKTDRVFKNIPPGNLPGGYVPPRQRRGRKRY